MKDIVSCFKVEVLIQLVEISKTTMKWNEHLFQTGLL